MKRLHPEFRALAVARKVIAGGKPTASVVEDRANAERWIQRFASGDIEAGSHITKGEYATVIHPTHLSGAVRRANFRVLYIHGGGMVYYDSVTFTPLLQLWANALGTPIEAFDYKKVPEHTLEESISELIQCVDAQLGDDRTPTVLAGDSVGALLALYVATKLSPGRFAKLLLIYPVLDLISEQPSYEEFGEGYFLDKVSMRRFREFLRPYFQARKFNPFKLDTLQTSALPSINLVTSGCDVLRDEALSWKIVMEISGASVSHLHFNDLPHDFCLYAGKLKIAKAAVTKILSTINTDETGEEN